MGSANHGNRESRDGNCGLFGSDDPAVLRVCVEDGNCLNRQDGRPGCHLEDEEGLLQLCISRYLIRSVATSIMTLGLMGAWISGVGS